MGIMTGLLGCCSSSTLGSRAKDYVKTSLRPGFDCIIRPAPEGAGRTTPEQTGHTGDPLHSRAACTQPCNVNTHSRAHCSPGARLCEQWGHGCVNNGARLCASARLCRGSPVGHYPLIIPCIDRQSPLFYMEVRCGRPRDGQQYPPLGTPKQLLYIISLIVADPEMGSNTRHLGPQNNYFT